jgi:hypothetical protein
VTERKDVGFEMQGVYEDEIPGILKLFAYFALSQDVKNELSLIKTPTTFHHVTQK